MVSDSYLEWCDNKRYQKDKEDKREERAMFLDIKVAEAYYNAVLWYCNI
jgi:hypothetical protein